MRVLLIEDDLVLAESITAGLRRARYIPDVIQNAGDAEEALRANVYDLAIIDRTLPDGDGLDLLGRMPKSRPPVLILTARAMVEDRIAGLDAGADDYLTKPFSFDELLARLRALLRRPGNRNTSDTIQFGNVEYDSANRQISVEGVPLMLPRRDLACLEALLLRFNRVTRRETLEDATYGFDETPESNALDAQIWRVRRKLIEARATVTIRTVRGVGHILTDHQQP